MSGEHWKEDGDSSRRTVREEWRSRTRYGKLFVPLLAVGRLLGWLWLLVFLVILVVVVTILWLFLKAPDIVVDRLSAWVSKRTPAVYHDDGDHVE